MSVLLFLVGLFAMLGMDNVLVICMMLDLFIFQATMGTYTWVYIGQVAEEKASSLAIFTIWFGTFILALITDSLFNSLGSQGTFWLFSGLTFVGAVFIILTIKETKGLTAEEIKVLYVPKKLRKQPKMSQPRFGIANSIGPEDEGQDLLT